MVKILAFFSRKFCGRVLDACAQTSLQRFIKYLQKLANTVVKKEEDKQQEFRGPITRTSKKHGH